MKLKESLKRKAWHAPWIITIVSIYAFCLPWIAFAIINRYHIKKDYDTALPGLNTTPARKFFMVGHMTLGGVCLLLGPLQLMPWVRNRFRLFHRIIGRIYVLSALLCSIFGLIFICLKRFILVGGINMGIAFAIAGITFGTCAFMTFHHGRNKQYTKHRNWAIRSFSQILSPMLYRYFYLILGGLGLYSFEGRECDDRDVCTPFINVFDSVHAWTYFIVPLLFAEGVVRSLPSGDHVIDNTIEMQEDDVEMSDGQKDLSAEFDYTRLNVLSILGAASCLGSTILIYVTSYTGSNTAAY